MKNIFPVFVLCLILCGCGEDAPPPNPNSSYTPPTYKKSEPAVGVPVQPAAATQPIPATPVASAQATKPATPQTTPTKTAQPTAAATPATGTGNTGRPSTQMINDASVALDYGTGAATLNVKKKQEDKIQAIQNQYNQGTNKSINGK